jgi:hypothetical protein
MRPTGPGTLEPDDAALQRAMREVEPEQGPRLGVTTPYGKRKMFNVAFGH